MSIVRPLKFLLVIIVVISTMKMVLRFISFAPIFHQSTVPFEPIECSPPFVPIYFNGYQASLSMCAIEDGPIIVLKDNQIILEGGYKKGVPQDIWRCQKETTHIISDSTPENCPSIPHLLAGTTNKFLNPVSPNIIENKFANRCSSGFVVEGSLNDRWYLWCIMPHGEAKEHHLNGNIWHGGYEDGRRLSNWIKVNK